MVEAGGHSAASPQEASESSLSPCSRASELEEPFANTQGEPGRMTIKVKAEDSEKAASESHRNEKKKNRQKNSFSFVFPLGC